MIRAMFRSGLALLLAALMLPSLGWAQTTDRGEMNQWVQDTQHQTIPPIGTTISMSNWRQYKTVMPLGMQKLFEGVYGWKMPADVQIEIGPAQYNMVPKSWIEATEKYGSQTQVVKLPNGHYQLKNYVAGTPFPHPAEPYKGWKILANNFWFVRPALYVNSDQNNGTVWSVDKYGDVSPETFMVVYRQADYLSDPGFPRKENYAPGMWQTQWAMQLTPEQARYTASLSMFAIDQEAHPYPETFVFVPALRRSLQLSTTSRCSPVFGLDWTYDDANGNGFNGSTSVYTAHWLADRNILDFTSLSTNSVGANFPADYDMPIAFPKPSWGKWSIRPASIIDVHRIPSEAAGYCYASRIMYVDKELWGASWVDLYDSNDKLWKAIYYYGYFANIPGLGVSGNGVSSAAYDLQNTHMTIWCGFANQAHKKPYIDFQAPKEYFNGTKYGSPAGLMTIMR